MMKSMDTRPFTSDATDDLELACEIERDAELLGAAATLERYLAAIADSSAMPVSTDAAIEVALRAAGERDASRPLEAARSLALKHPALADAIHAVAFGLGLPDASSSPMVVGELFLGRWRIVEILGSGATAQVARARDELHSSGTAAVEVAIKRFEDGFGADARLHAFREMRALIAAPAGLAARVVALHAPQHGAACIVTRHEETREMRVPDDLATAVEAVRHLHRAGIAHVDLKPAHIRIRPDGSVLLVDFGTAEPATTETRRQDFLRLLEMAALGCPSPASRALTRMDPIRMALIRMARASRRNGVAASALRALSPRWRRRMFLRGGVALLLASALGLGWSSWPSSTRQADSFAALAKTGRFVDATVDAEGRLIGLRLDIPELSALDPDASVQRIETGAVRFRPDGGVAIFNVDGDPMSR
jgi:predicted Ser/Thr protein kinase